jgi:3-oxoacyl-[acyl-carrier-protein] synthase II
MKRRVVVTGMGAISPVGRTMDESWTSLLEGRSGIDYISSFDPEGLETRIAGEVKGFDATDHVSRKEARRMDRFAQLAIAAALEAVEQADVTIDANNCERVAVMIASGIGGIITLSEQIGVMDAKGASRISPFLIPMMLPDMASAQVSMLLGAKGPNFATVSACSSGADSLGQAFLSVRRGAADIVLAGGSEAAICPIGIAGFNASRALSKRNHEPQKASRPFDAERDGFVLGEGAAVLVLESIESAIDRGVPVIAEIIGYGSTADAHHITQPAPGGEGGARAMILALAGARLEPREIDYINAHGTSTVLNDKYETMAMKTVFGDDAHKVSISSTKSMTGHLLGACGAFEAAVAVMSIRTGAVPPTINLDVPDPDCDLDYTPNVPAQGTIKNAMSNCFGFGGHNASLVFQAVES